MTREDDADLLGEIEGFLTSEKSPFGLTKTWTLLSQLKFEYDGLPLDVFDWHDTEHRRFRVNAPFYNRRLDADFEPSFLWGPYGLRDTSHWDAQDIGERLSSRIEGLWLQEDDVDSLNVFG